jgi:hypothetical protein
MYQCGICVASFSRKHDMERHRRTHTGEAPYGESPFSIPTLGQLLRENNKECEGCGTVFSRVDGRGRHFKLQPECEVAHYAKSQGKPKRKGSMAGMSGDELGAGKM